MLESGAKKPEFSALKVSKPATVTNILIYFQKWDLLNISN